MIDHCLATTLVSHGVVDVYNCQWNYATEPGVEGWYIQAMGVWANLTGDDSLTETCVSLIMLSFVMKKSSLAIVFVKSSQ